jgi:uroporphyrinogen-III decarboxylase
MTEKHLLESPADAEKYLSLPPQEPSGDLEGFSKRVADMGERGIVEIGLGLNPAGFVADLFGTECFALMCVQHRDIVHELMRRRMETMLRLVEYVLGRGGGPYFAMLGEEYVVPPIHGPQDFRDFNVRYDRPILDLVHGTGGLMHIHCHGSLGAVLESFAEIGPDVLHPVEGPPMGDVSPREARRALGESVCIEGNLQIADMIDGRPQSIREQVSALIQEVWLPRRRGLIVAPTASPYLPKMTPRMLANYRALVETARRPLE